MILKSISAFVALAAVALAADAPTIRHSYLVMGGRTAIIDEDGKAEWEYAGGTRDGFVLPNGNVLLAFSDRVEEVTRTAKSARDDLGRFNGVTNNHEDSAGFRQHDGAVHSSDSFGCGGGIGFSHGPLAPLFLPLDCRRHASTLRSGSGGAGHARADE